MILVNMALKPEVIHALRRQDREIWAAVLDQAECCAERILADAE